MADTSPTVFPDPTAVAGLPAAVSIYEVGPRDGLQAEKSVVPTEVKIEFIHRLERAGLRAVEATSFVSPRWVPQLADAAEVMAGLDAGAGVRHPVLVPNERGYERARAAGADEIAVFVSATERFARENLGTTVEGALRMAAPVVRDAIADGVAVRGYVSMCFGDPWEGRVLPAQPAEVAARLAELGCATISLGDTIGVATAGQVGAVVDAVVAAGVPRQQLALHFHDTYGQALANVLAGLRAGITEFDASAGGLGGCPYARSATGNLATEDLVWLLTGLGIDTGIDLAALARTSVWMAGQLGRPSPSRVVTALSAPST
ncbi:MAG: hydroxymethylglutaryl-CoA lyase [Propionibacteriaceae bacterium]|jgi:hydroxymethylglutaryl-CoA lyase|nr:hydroxymethylglutaryl-CoA lyase [Propionibacteriaceae bacterium]